MTERRLAPLSALSTLTRRPPRPAPRAPRPRPSPTRAPDRRQRRLLRRPPCRHARDRRGEPRGAGARRGPARLAGPVPPGAARARWAGRAVRPARARRRGRDPGPPAAEVRAVRGHAVRRPQGRPVPGCGRGGGVRRAAPVPGGGLRHHGAAQRVAGPVPGAPPAGERAGAAGQGQRGGAVRDPGRRRRRLLPVVAGLATDIDEIETEVFRGDPGVSRRIYELSQEVLEFQRAALR